jgi:hypothetical protein
MRSALIAMALFGVFWGEVIVTPSHAPAPRAEGLAAPSYGNLPLYFEENNGQTDPQVRYFARAGGYSLFATDSRIAFNLILDEPLAPKQSHRLDFADLESRDESVRPTRTYGLYLDFVGANASPTISGESVQESISSYFRGSPDQWVTAVSHFEKVRYTDLYPGIDAVFYGSAQQVQYDFIVASGADPSRIQLRFDPVERITLAKDGDLQLSLGDRVLTMNAPYTYQTIDGEEREIESSFVLNDGTVTFSVGAYDSALPLVIDPVIVYSGYIGGSSTDRGVSIAVDSSGSAYITGYTGSSETTFPEVGGPDLTYNSGSEDAFVAKINPAGTALIYAGYIGGAGIDTGIGIAVDSSGNAYITGWTESNEASFPEVGGPDLIHNGGFDAFVAKINPAGTALVYAGYIGGSGNELGYRIAVDSGGNAYITGWTESSETSFPEVGGPDLIYNGSADAFIAKVNPTGTALVYAGYIGGTNIDIGQGVAVDSNGSAYITGETNSSDDGFPEVGGPDLWYNGGADAFVVKINPAGTALVYAGYIGGWDGEDYGRSIAVDSSGSAYVTGETNSDYGFPKVGGPDLSYNGGTYDAFVAKVNPAGTALVYAGYIGGTGFDYGAGIAVDSSGSAYITGWTDSSESSFPVMAGPDLSYNGGTYDAFVAKVNPTGTMLAYAGYIGGTGSDRGLGVAVDSSGSAYITGETNSAQTSFPIIGGPDLTYNGGGDLDGFVAKVDLRSLVQNAGFETRDSAQASKAQKWVGGHLTKDNQKCNTISPPVIYSRSGNCAFLFKGGIAEKSKITQTVKFGEGVLAAGIPLTLSGWVDSPTNSVLAKVVLYHTDGSRIAFSVLMGPSVGYQRFVAAPFYLVKPSTKLKLSFQHSSASGKLYLDDVEVVVATAPTRNALLPVPEPPIENNWRSP